MTTSTQSWFSSEHSSQLLTLSGDEVHVWRASLDLTADYVQNLQNTLSTDEKIRAERFQFQKDRIRFIVARGLLRAVLSRYLGREPSHLRFCYSPYGKPALNSADGGDSLCFNLSHSHGLVLYAVTRNQEIGIDLEYLRTDFSWEEIAERFFSPGENAALQKLPANLKHKAFFTCWTRKEAFIKATGKGLLIPLNTFDVSLVPGEPAALLSTQWNPQEAHLWSLKEIVPGSGYVAALAVKGDSWQLKCWQWL